MKRRITRKSLDELQKALTTLSFQEQTYYVGGGNGSKEDPYTFVEYQDLLSRRSWLGGYVMGSTTTYNKDESGNFVKTEIIEAIYIEKDESLLEDAGEIYSGVSGIYTDAESIMSSGFLYTGDSYDCSGNYGSMLETLGVEGGGGRSSRPQQDTTFWDAKVNVIKFSGFQSSDKTGCLKRCREMIGTHLKKTVEIPMVMNNGQGRAGDSTSNYHKGINLIQEQLRKNKPVILGVDYQEGVINEGITDHFIVVVSSGFKVVDGRSVRVYYYMDPITKNEEYGTSPENYLYEKDGKLIGVYRHHRSRPNGLNYTVTQVRKYE